MFTLLFVLFGILAVLIVVALLIEYFPGRTRRRNRDSNAHWNAPFIIDSDTPDFSQNDADGGWFDGGDVDVD